jgi:hypothetical protein
MEIESGDIKRTPHVQPVGRANHAFIAEAEYLAASEDINPTFGRTSGKYSADLRGY